jgi:hypothetical protein
VLARPISSIINSCLWCLLVSTRVKLCLHL